MSAKRLLARTCAVLPRPIQMAVARACFCVHGCNVVTGQLFRPDHIRDAILSEAR